MKKSETEEKQRKKFKLEVYWSCFGYATALINNASEKKNFLWTRRDSAFANSTYKGTTSDKTSKVLCETRV